MGNVRTAGAECAGCFFCLPGAIFFPVYWMHFSSLIDDLFFAFFGSMEIWRSLSVYCGSTEGKKTCGPENAIARGKKTRKISSCGSGRKKKLCQTRKSRKNGSGKLIFTNQTRTRRKISLHNAKKSALAGLREKKSRVRHAHCYAGREDPRNI